MENVLGTIFKVTTSGGESVLRSFYCGKDGAIGDLLAEAGPAVLNGKLYGVVPSGAGGERRRQFVG
jgi:hypothetical protein